MSSSNPSDPRLLLPEWLRDGDVPAVAVIEPQPLATVAEPSVAAAAEVAAVEIAQPRLSPLTPFSDRLSLDTRLDPAQLVEASDLPAWLGGPERQSPLAPVQKIQAEALPSAQDIDEPLVYDEVDAPEEGVIDVQVNGWYLVAGAIGLLILLAAAFRLYLA